MQTLQEGIYIGIVNGPIGHRRENTFDKHKTGFSIVCTDCLLSKNPSIQGQCPKCFAILDKGRMGRMREEYFGIGYSYYGVMLKSCPTQGCHFTVANDEWDQ